MNYSANPDLGFPVVKTITGELEYERYCKKSLNKWYIVNKQCLYINKRWYYADRTDFYYDHELKVYTISTKNMTKGIIDFDENNLPVFGYFSANPYTNCGVIINDVYYLFIDYKLLEQKGFIENKSMGTWYDPNTIELHTYLTILSNENEISYRNKGYNIEDNVTEFEEKLILYAKNPIAVKKQIILLAKLLGDITWGCENEFAKGGLPDYIKNQYGIVMCRDGSTSSGGEAVLIPYSGAKGLQSMFNVGAEMNNRLTADISCSFHIHIGNLPLNRSYLAALYRLCLLIQDELFQAFPYYKTDSSGIKSKNYNKKLTSLFSTYKKTEIFTDYTAYINNAYSKLFQFLSDGQLPNYQCNRKQAKHPINLKWERRSRYYWVNFQNAIFSKRKTIEFRLHHGTLNPQKMIFWLFICTAICRYAETHMTKLLTSSEPVSLTDVLNYYKYKFPANKVAVNLSECLVAYIKSRKAEFKKDTLNGDIIGKRELEDDADYKFSFNSITDLFN